MRVIEQGAVLVVSLLTIGLAIMGIGMASDQELKQWRFFIVGLVVCMIFWMLVALKPEIVADIGP